MNFKMRQAIIQARYPIWIGGSCYSAFLLQLRRRFKRTIGLLPPYTECKKVTMATTAAILGLYLVLSLSGTWGRTTPLFLARSSNAIERNLHHLDDNGNPMVAQPIDFQWQNLQNFKQIAKDPLDLIGRDSSSGETLPPSNVLLDKDDFIFLLTPTNVSPERSEAEARIDSFSSLESLATPAEVDPAEVNSHSRRPTQSLFFLVLVHSKPENFERRQVIRETWGSIREMKDQGIKVVFLLGEQPPSAPIFSSDAKAEVGSFPKGVPRGITNSLLTNMKSPDSSSRNVTAKEKSASIGEGSLSDSMEPISMRMSVQEQILEEQRVNGDIIQGNFEDINENESYKHMMGFKWVSQFRRDAPEGNTPRYIIKADDDAFIEIFHLFRFVRAIYGSQPSLKSIICEVVPNGVATRETLEVVGRSQFSQGAFDSVGEEPHQWEHPEYCRGLAYLMTPDLVDGFLKAASKVPLIRDDDDIHIMGFMRALLDVKPFYLNLRYTHEDGPLRKWLHNRQLSPDSAKPFPYLFARVHSDHPDWKDLMLEAWRYTMSIQLAHGL